jgi:hypothetical protein
MELGDKIVEMMLKMVVERELEREPHRFHRQDAQEKRRRLLLIEQLAVELHEAKEKSIFATTFAEDALAAVFNGDWDEVEALRQMIDPNEDRSTIPWEADQLRHLSEFCEILCVARPEGDA